MMKEIQFNKSADLYNMILGGLIALYSEQQIGKVVKKPVSETLFLGKWLKGVKKQRRYPKSLAIDIDNFLRLYAIEGRSADLSVLFKQIYNEFQLFKDTAKDFEFSAKHRFDHAVELLQKQDWHISLPITHDPYSDEPYRPTFKKELFTTKWYWQDAFDEQGNLTKAVSMFVVSNPQEVIDCLYVNGFILVKGLTSQDEQGNYYYQYKMFPDNKCFGEAAIPSRFQH